MRPIARPEIADPPPALRLPLVCGPLPNKKQPASPPRRCVQPWHRQRLAHELPVSSERQREEAEGEKEVAMRERLRPLT